MTDEERDGGAPREGAGDESAGDPAGQGAGDGLSAAQLARLRETLLAAYPDAVPELIAGGDFEALLASVGPARDAYRRVREEAAREAAAGVPRGGGVREPDPALYAGLAPEAKIAAGLAAGVGRSGGRAGGQ
ncbi:MAG TPA: hypothetical protein VFW96_14465 [Thermomicrobiales bacterium]|nr:hypothetical protein [Thermomicrobiales bacterium]